MNMLNTVTKLGFHVVEKNGDDFVCACLYENKEFLIYLGNSDDYSYEVIIRGGD